MKNLKKIIILLIIIILIIITLILILQLNKQKSSAKKESIQLEDVKETNVNSLSYKEYSIVSNCFQSYVDTIDLDNSNYYGYDDNDEYVKIAEDIEIKTNIYELLSSTYIKDKNISIDNVFEFVDTIKGKHTAVITNIYEMNSKTNTIGSFYTKGFIIPISDIYKYKEITLIVNVDYSNNTFSIEPLRTDTNEKDIKLAQIEKIKENDLNVYFVEEMQKEDILKKYFDVFKYMMLFKPKTAYEKLNNEYREKRFPEINDFEQYINVNKEKIEKLRLNSYQVLKNDGENGARYNLFDQFSNSYIIIEKAVMNCSFILDTYTIDLPEFIEKYNSTTEQGKVALNIQKFTQALNEKDYKYAYNCLSSGFKKNNFNSLEDFENYIQENWFEDFKVEYGEFEESAGIFKYTISMRNKDENALIEDADEEITKTIIMKLNEGTDFEMSFDV